MLNAKKPWLDFHNISQQNYEYSRKREDTADPKILQIAEPAVKVLAGKLYMAYKHLSKIPL